MINQHLLDYASRAMLAQGVKVLQGFRLGASEQAHTAALLARMRPGPGECWLDIGCGFGEPARLMHELQPDLDFVLLNNNRYQLTHAPAQFEVHFADMHTLPFDAGKFDGVMLLFSLCHADNVRLVLAEAARVVRPGGTLFVFDYVREQGNNRRTGEILQARFYTRRQLDEWGEQAGWHTVLWEHPSGDDTVFQRSFGEDAQDAALFEELISPLRPVIWRAERRAEA